MSKKLALTGKVFGRLTVISEAPTDGRKKSLWQCRCECGSEKVIIGQYLVNGDTRSCGCLLREFLDRGRVTHGLSKTATHRAWCGMITRCYNPNRPIYKDYGGRGIQVCERWHKFESFLKDIGEHPGPGYSLDRIDNNKGYSKENCRWATRQEQNRNRRNKVLLTFHGKTQHQKDWAREIGIAEATLKNRIAQGWSDDQIVKPSDRAHMKKRGARARG